MDEEISIDFTYVTQRSRRAPFETRRIQAPSTAAAEKMLMDQRIPVLSLRRTKEPVTKKIGKLNNKDKLLFFQQIRTSYAAGLPMSRTLELALDSTEVSGAKQVIARLKNEVEAGESLASAMRATRAFDELQVGVVEAGEQTATLGDACKQIVDVMNRSMALQKKLRTIMTYPVMVVVSAIICIYVLVTRVIPEIVPFFASAGEELPAPTKLVAGVAAAAEAQPLLAILATVGLIVLTVMVPSIYKKWLWCHPKVIEMPVVGPFIKLLIQETFSRTFVNLARSGVQTIDSLRLLRNISVNHSYKAAVARCILALAHGEPLGEAIRDEKAIFGSYLVAAISFGEMAGRLDEVLDQMSTQLSLDVQTAIEQFKESLTPIITWVLAVIVFFILAAAFMPIFMLPSLIGK